LWINLSDIKKGNLPKKGEILFMSKFSAKPQTLGYLHQIRYSLLVLLENESAELRLEELDDVDLSRPGNPIDLLQFKHRSPDTKLSNSSPDLWKTLNIWSTHIADGSISINEGLFFLITTAKATDGSAASLLKINDRRPEKAYNILVKIANSSENDALKSSFQAFLSLDDVIRKSLISKVHIIDSSPNIENSRIILEQKLRLSVKNENISSAADRIEGWWFDRCINHLNRKIQSLSYYEVTDKIIDIVHQFKTSSLPIDFIKKFPKPEEKKKLEGSQFVYQLNCIGVSSERIQNALIDYYRAFHQRSRWVRDQLLIGDEIETYEEKLQDEWNRLRLSLEDEIEKPLAEDTMQALGRKLYNWMEFNADFRIRENVSEPYVMRGSYHMLADDTPPKVWWHPDFFSKLKDVIGGEEK